MSRWRWQKAASRTASRSMNARIEGAWRATIALASSRRSSQAVRRSSSVRTSASSSATARTMVRYCSYMVASTITVG